MNEAVWRDCGLAARACRCRRRRCGERRTASSRGPACPAVAMAVRVLQVRRRTRVNRSAAGCMGGGGARVICVEVAVRAIPRLLSNSAADPAVARSRTPSCFSSRLASRRAGQSSGAADRESVVPAHAATQHACAAASQGRPWRGRTRRYQPESIAARTAVGWHSVGEAEHQGRVRHCEHTGLAVRAVPSRCKSCRFSCSAPRRQAMATKHDGGACGVGPTNTNDNAVPATRSLRSSCVGKLRKSRRETSTRPS